MKITHLHFLLALDGNKSIRIGDTHEMYIYMCTHVHACTASHAYVVLFDLRQLASPRRTVLRHVESRS